MKLATVPVVSTCIVLCLTLPDITAAQGTHACSARAIRAAAEKQVTPRLVGCRYTAVAVPLAQYFAIYPALTKTPGAQADNIILEQTPQAGEPLAAGGQLALNVSVGLPAKASQTENRPLSSGNGAPVEMVDEAGSEVPPTVTLPQATASVEVEPAKPVMPSLKPFSISYLLRPDLVWVWGVIVLILGGLIGLAFRRQSVPSADSYERVPQVTARFNLGPGRLNVTGPLVVAAETGT